MPLRFFQLAPVLRPARVVAFPAPIASRASCADDAPASRHCLWRYAAAALFSGVCHVGHAQAPSQPDADAGTLTTIVVTATARAEASSRIAGTIQVIDQAAIARSTAPSVTDVLAEHATGFFSEWTPAQTSINLRGAATDGQGRDFRSQVLVLVNGRRAGTANLSKLSLSDVERIEIVRGPSSVLYGSQNMGGVINIILKRGHARAPTRTDLRTGSWGLRQAQVQTGGATGDFDWYLGAHAGARNDYDSGHGSRMDNTQWKRRGVTAALGWQMAALRRLDLNVRTDGVFDAGFRGSGANTLSRDNRANRSVDLTYEGEAPDQRANWMTHVYAVRDIDEFNWASPVIRAGTSAVPGTARDYSRRTLDVTGIRVQPRWNLSAGNDLLLGVDAERSRLRSDRVRTPMPGGPAGQIAPIDINQTEHVYALYFEDAQDVWDDRLTLRIGARKTWGRAQTDPTPNLALVPALRTYDALTWSLGATLRASDEWTLRASAATGFRAPTATELGANITALGGSRMFGNPDLTPERSRQIEWGSTWQTPGGRVDAALFQNTIRHRIITVSRGAGTNASDYANNGADIVVRGLELGADVDVSRALGWNSAASSISLFGNGYYHFAMKDKGSAPTAKRNKVQRMYRHEWAGGVRYRRHTDGQTGAWGVQLTALHRGPMWYDTEESLLIPLGEPARNHIHRKRAFTVWNLRGDVQLTRTLKMYAAVNNLLNKNEHPIFIAIDRGAGCIADPQFQNGGCGTSMPGREFQIGLQARF